MEYHQPPETHHHITVLYLSTRPPPHHGCMADVIICRPSNLLRISCMPILHFYFTVLQHCTFRMHWSRSDGLFHTFANTDNMLIKSKIKRSPNNMDITVADQAYRTMTSNPPPLPTQHATADAGNRAARHTTSTDNKEQPFDQKAP